MKEPKVSLINLGCPKNQVDGERVLANYAQRGFIIAPSDPDLLIINTCAFIAPAVRESLSYLRRAIQKKRNGELSRIVLMGCLPERYPHLKEEYSEVDKIIPRDKVSYLECENAPRVLTTYPYAYLKIAEGCSRNCSFCLIPKLRGEYRSLPPSFLIQEASNLKDLGIKELVLVAQDLTLWGKDLSSNLGLLNLLERISALGFLWIRLLYLYPKITRSFIRKLKALGNILPYLDLPFQHVDSHILSSMGRGQSEKEVRETVEMVRQEWPEAALRSSFIVGFPGEGRAEFEKLLRFVEETRFDRLAIFPYYDEQGIEGEKGGRIGKREKAYRYEELMSLQEQIYSEKAQALIGKTEIVLIDQVKRGRLIGRTYRDAPLIDAHVFIEGEGRVGDFRQVLITKAHGCDLIGKST